MPYIETSAGTIELTASEHQFLSRLLAGQASMAEGQAFYAGLAKRNTAFPMEWEVHILRATVAALPDRDDLIMRLALVEETLASRMGAPNLTDRLSFERAWTRFSHADLTKDDPQTAIDDACVVLSSNVFSQKPLSRRVEIIVAVHNTLMSLPSRDLPVVAELGLRRFQMMLLDPALTESQACIVYDSLHALYFAGVSDVRDLRRFDEIVPPFERWLEARHGRHLPPRVERPAGRMLTIAYLLHTAHFDRGNAVAPLICSLAEMHAKHPDRRILLYAVQYIGPGFVERMTSRGVIARSFPQESRYDAIDEIARSLNTDNVDVVITEQNKAIGSALFVRRVAPRQLWIDTGFPFWSLRALDWTLSATFSAEPSSPPRTSRIVFRQTEDTLKSATNPQLSAQVRSAFPPDAFVLGVFVRLIKLNPAFREFLVRLLSAHSYFHLIIAGPGDPRPLEAFSKDPRIAQRTKFVHGSVDLNVYGPAIDLMCDTFPFIGGNACREVAAHGTPVVAKLGTPWDALLRADRNPELLANSEDDYIALAIRMATDLEFRERQRRITLEKAAEYSVPKDLIDDVEAAIAASIDWPLID